MSLPDLCAAGRRAKHLAAAALATMLVACGGAGQAPETCVESPVGSGYCLVWQDEFDTSELDLGKWSVEQNCWGGGNDEAQCYVDSDETLRLENGQLHIRAIAKAAVGPAVPEDDPAFDPQDTSGSGLFSSARIRSKHKGDWQYGRFEIRAKLPSGQGTWPAIWMLPTDSVYGGWAASGEIDIMEAVNLKVGGESRIHGTLHYGAQWPHNLSESVAYTIPDTHPSDAFHTYALEWELGEIRWYVDRVHYATQTAEGWHSNSALHLDAAPFDEPFHLILNLAVGGAWAGQVNDTGIDTDAFPQTLVVDYVRVYECRDNPVTGEGCATRGNDYTLAPGHTPPAEGSDLILFDDRVHAPFQWFVYSTSGSVDFQTVALDEPRGTVAEVRFDRTDGIGFFQTPSGLDLRDFSAVTFDWRVVSDTRGAGEDFIFRADCTFPCSSGSRTLTAAPLGDWQTSTIALADLAATGLELTGVNTPFVIGPAQATQLTVVQFDSVRLVK